MKLSTNCHYATITLMDLAIHQATGPVPLKDIAQRHNVSVRHLARAVVPLQNAGIVNSHRGIGGGFTLKKAPETINIGDIYRLFEGSFTIVDDVKEFLTSDKPDFCSINYIWDEIEDRIYLALSSKTIGDLINIREPNFERAEFSYSVWDDKDLHELYTGVFLS